MRRLILFVSLFFGVAYSQYPGARPVPGKWARGFNSIKVSDAREILSFLAGPDCLGRGAKQSGFAVAAGYSAAWFRQSGISPAGDDGSYFQRFSVDKVSIDPASVSFPSEDGTAKLEWLSEFSISSADDVDARVEFVFVRLAPDATVDSIDSRLVKDKVVIYHPDNFNVLASGAIRTAMINAGAIALVTPDTSTRQLTTLQATSLRGTPQASNPLATLRLKDAAARRIAESSGARNYLAQTVTTSTAEPCTMAFRLRAKVTRVEDHSTMNVVVKIPGSDQQLKDEAVVIGAHLDHVGVTARGTFWGADDNASGSTAAMLIARAIALNPVKPKRTIIIALWSDEEQGLFGSEYYVNKPAIPLAQTVAYLNLDMVGRNSQFPRWGDLPENNIDAVYSATAKLNSPDLYKLLQDENRFLNFNLRDDKEDRTMRSDTGSFVKRGVPSLKAFSGEHPDYHAISDTIDKVNFDKLTNVAKWIYISAMELATQQQRPAFEKDVKYLSGTVSSPTTITLPPDAVIEVSLLDVSRADAAGSVLDRTTSIRPGQLPMRWTLRYSPSSLKVGATYTVQARITARGKLLFSSSGQIRVLQPGQAASGVDVPVTPANGG